jgi:hypothetical protein
MPQFNWAVSLKLILMFILLSQTSTTLLFNIYRTVIGDLDHHTMGLHIQGRLETGTIRVNLYVCLLQNTCYNAKSRNNSSLHFVKYSPYFSTFQVNIVDINTICILCHILISFV